MSVDHSLQTDAQQRVLGPGTLLVNRAGQIKILRSRTADGAGWNCADGAGIADIAANDPDMWMAYTPGELVADLGLAAEVRELGGHRELSGGLATWDACSGRPCQLPKLAKVVRESGPAGGSQPMSWLPLE